MDKTPFEKTLEDINLGKLKPPFVLSENASIPYIKYQLAVHKMQLNLFAKGLKHSQVKLKDLKQYYGLKGKTAAQCLNEFMEIYKQHVN